MATGNWERRATPRFAQPTWGFPGEAREKWRSRPVSRVLSRTVIPLGASSPIRSSSLPGPDAGHVMRSLFGLAPGGVCRAGLLPGSRCALTAPFHPCHASARLSAAGPFGGIFLLHFPSARAAQALPGTVPCGARTFLGTRPCKHARMTRLSGRLRRWHCRMRGTASPGLPKTGPGYHGIGSGIPPAGFNRCRTAPCAVRRSARQPVWPRSKAADARRALHTGDAPRRFWRRHPHRPPGPAPRTPPCAGRDRP